MRGLKDSRLILFINNRLNEPLRNEGYELNTWHNHLNIINTDFYHRVAQSFNQTKLASSKDSGIFYFITVPRHENGEYGDTWNISLAKTQEKEFLNKYREHYQIRSIDSNQK